MSQPAETQSGITRRVLLTGLGAAAGLAAGRGLGVNGLGSGEAQRLSHREALDALVRSLSQAQRDQIVLPGDHPSRRLNNTIAFLDRPHLGTLLAPGQRVLAERLAATMLSPKGRADFAHTLAVEGRLEGCVLAVYGEPERGPAHSVIMGGHVNLRGGGSDAQGVAFGGGVAWGHQVGNHRYRVEGNAFAPQGERANAVYAGLDAPLRNRARLPEAPHELVLQPQGAEGRFDGVAGPEMGDASREALEALLASVLATWTDADAAEVRSCIDANGGPDALHLAFYENYGSYPDMRRFGELSAGERRERGEPYWQVWRLEGPGSVIHFQGYPHVHAYLHVARDPVRAYSGETLAELRGGLAGAPLRDLIEAAMRRASGEALAFQSAQVPGRFCPGPVTPALVWSLDPYANRIVVATIAGRAMGEALRQRLEAAGTAVEPGGLYRVATLDFTVREDPDFGQPERVDGGGALLRTALEAHIRAGGLSAT